MALTRDGILWAWGSNAYGQLGDGTNEDKNFPVEVGSGYTTIAAGSSSSSGLKEDGTLWECVSIYGQSPVNRPVLIGTDYTSLVENGHELALKMDDTLWAWGYNQFGQVGDSTNEDKVTPVQIGSGFLAVSAGRNFSIALKTDGSLWSWGWNYYHQLGDGTTVDKNIPVQIH
jgi:alpha-tubulin suppressor-like RCC1 family protein